MFNRAYVEITNVCNLHCDFCPGPARPAGFMTVADFAAGQGYATDCRHRDVNRT